MTHCPALLRRCLFGALVALLPISLAASAQAAITVTNLRDGETLRYPVALLRGTAPGASRVEVANRDNSGPDGRNEAPVVEGRYIVLVELVPGRNRLSLAAGVATADLTLSYQPMTTPYKVNVVWATGSDGDTRYETPRPGDPQDYRERLDIAAKLMQTFTAEALNDAGYGRRTFNLEYGPDGKVVVHTVAYPLPASELRTKDGNQLYSLFYGWIDKQFPMERNKNLVLMAFTRYDRQAQRALAHTALGGGGMGLFGSGDLFCWPQSIHDVTRVFSDATPVDKSTTLDDSAFRGVTWGLASTTLGATLHEMGHTFGLPHASDPFCIMSRGFDRFNRYFTLVEPPHARRKEAYAFKPDEVAHWSDYYAAQLACNRWFQPDARPRDERRPPTLRVDWKKDEFVLEAPRGIAMYGVRSEGAGGVTDKASYAVFDRGLHGAHARREGAQSVRLSRPALWAELGNKGKLQLLLIDREGNTVSAGEKDLRDPDDFLHQWRLLPAALPWRNSPASPELSDAQREALVAALRRQRPRDFRNGGRGPFYSFDFLECYGAKENQVAYALATVRSAAEKAMSLLVGHDDGLRAWLNGKEVVNRPGLRFDAADAGAVPVTLAPGENTILVEVTQGGGGWGFSLRLAEVPR